MKNDLAKLYDEIAENYDIADKYGSLTTARNRAIAQLEKYFSETFGVQNSPEHSEKCISVVDLGAGDGTFLDRLTPTLKTSFKNADYVGLDISANMLQLAREKVPLKTVVGKITDIEKLMAPDQFDLAVCHFVLAYVDIASVLSKAKQVLKDQGHITLVTTTREAMQACRQHVLDRIGKGGVSGFLIGRIYNRTLRSILIPESYKDIENAVKAAGLTIANRSMVEIPIYFKDLDEFMEVSFKGGWMANLIDIKYLPAKVGLFLARQFFGRTMKFPINDTQIIEVVLLKKEICRASLRKPSANL